MKKILSIVLGILLLVTLTGCEDDIPLIKGNFSKIKENSKSEINIMVCTKSELEDGYQMDQTIEIKYTPTQLKSITSNISTEVPDDYIDLLVTNSQAQVEELNEMSGINYQVLKGEANSVNYILEVDYTMIDAKEFKKSFKEYIEDDDIFTDHIDNFDFETFKHDLLDENYNCN